MPARTNEFQKLILFIKKHLAPTVAITESKLLKDRLTGAEREVDVCLEQQVGGHNLIISIECTDARRRADVTWVEQMKSKHDRLPTNLLVLASASGFTEGAMDLAKVSGIETLELNALTQVTYHDTPAQPLPEMRYVDASAKAGESHTYAVIMVNGVGLRSMPSHESTNRP